MIDDIYRALGQEQNSFLSIQSPFYDKTLKGYDYNPEKAKELLLEAGFKYNNGLLHTFNTADRIQTFMVRSGRSFYNNY